MKGIEIITRWASISETKKWDTEGYDYSKIVKELTDNDKSVINALFRVGDGELSGIGMMVELNKQTTKHNLIHVFYEAMLYGSNVIVYEEYRHGLVIKELYNALNGLGSFIDNVSGEYIRDNYFNIEELWSNPYEVIVSLLVGEITNTVIYEKAANVVDHPKLKEILNNIARDERRHMFAWRDLSKKICDEPGHRDIYIENYNNIHQVHQAEVNGYYKDAAKDTVFLFSEEVVMSIFNTKIELYEYVTSTKVGLKQKNKILMNHIKHFKEVINGN